MGDYPRITCCGGEEPPEGISNPVKNGNLAPVKSGLRIEDHTFARQAERKKTRHEAGWLPAISKTQPPNERDGELTREGGSEILPKGVFLRNRSLLPNTSAAPQATREVHAFRAARARWTQASSDIRYHSTKTAPQLEPSALQTICAVPSKFSILSISIGARPFNRS